MKPPPPRRALALAVLLATFPAVAVAAADLHPVPLDVLLGGQQSGAAGALTARGLEVQVSGYAHFVLPFAAEALEVEAASDGWTLLTWSASPPGGRARPYGPPWRHVRLPREPEALSLDLRIAEGWGPRAQPILLLIGGGTVVIRALRIRPPAVGDAARAAYDRAVRWAPESVGHTTINFLTPPLWSASRRVWLADVVAGLTFAAFAATLGIQKLRRRRLRPGLALAAASVVALAAWDAHFLARFLPMANLAVEPDAEARLRENVYVAPEVGALAAAARSALRLDERVGVVTMPNDWFASEMLCFDLQPRACAVVRPGEREHAGLSGVGRLRPEEIDAVVSYRGGPLPDGFVAVASVSPHAVVARRAGASRAGAR